MSLCCAWLDHERAIVVTDTRGTLALDGVEIHVTKCGIFPHMNALAVVLGNTDLSNAIGYMLAPLQGDYDLLVKHADQVIADACSLYEERVESANMRREQALLFVGWSRNESRIVALYGTWRDGVVETKRLGRGNFAQPDWPEYQGTPMDSPHALQHAAAEQIRYWSTQPENLQHLGGRLIVAEITEGRMTLDNVAIPLLADSVRRS
jgi:hypothetical protein